MSTLRINVGGNSYVGAFLVATDRFCILGPIGSKHAQRISRALGADTFTSTVSASNLVGIYAAANSKGLLLPFNAEERELSFLKESLQGVVVQRINSGANALKNNILANDKIAIVNPEYSRKDAAEIEDVLDVEVIRMKIANSSTVGASNILTNKGIVVNSRASEEEVKELEKIVNLHAEQATANTGSVYIGLSAVANTKGLVIGDETTGYEIARMESILL